MSLARDEVRRPPRAAVPQAARRDPRAPLTGLALASFGILLMALAFGDGVSQGREVVFSGDAGGEPIRGTNTTDRIAGAGGPDRVFGLGGADLVSGGSGDDIVSGGVGRDVVLAGEGDDLVDARDGYRDYVACGPGEDLAYVDAADRVDSGCETVETL